MAYHNIHTHIFTMQNAPEDFLSLYMPGWAAKAIDNITSTKAGARVTEKLLNWFGGSAGKKYASFLHVGKRSGQLDVFCDLLKQYPDSSMKITALTINMEELGADRSITGFEGQLEEIIEVKRRYPDRLLVFLGLDPRWKSTSREILERVKAYFEKRIHINQTRDDVFPFAGLKLYPSTGYYAFDEKLKETFEWAADNNVPVLTHCSYLGGIFNNDRDYLDASMNTWNPYTGKNHPAPKPQHRLEKKFFKRLVNIQKQTNNRNYSSYFLEPESYREMLTYFKERGTPLKLCFAHFGGSEHMKLQNRIQLGHHSKQGDYFGIKNTVNWTAQIQGLMKDFDTVYTDISYSLTDHATHDFIWRELSQPYGNRILFGTDYFMTEREAKEKNTFALFRKRAMQVTVNGPENGRSNAWQMIAHDNVERFLKSKYYTP